jgi:hypothetical protein
MASVYEKKFLLPAVKIFGGFVRFRCSANLQSANQFFSDWNLVSTFATPKNDK